MNATEFQATVHNGIITLPNNQESWNGKTIKVILLEEADNDVKELSDRDSTAETLFFSCAGIWENRDIDQESLREQAWPEHRR